ncbi:hypothetical protein ACWCOW_42870, partial [Streptomyces sp. NPDC001939]
GPTWSLMLYTDGLIEGRVGEGKQRLGQEGMVTHVPPWSPAVGMDIASPERSLGQLPAAPRGLFPGAALGARGRLLSSGTGPGQEHQQLAMVIGEIAFAV